MRKEMSGFSRLSGGKLCSESDLGTESNS